MPAKVRTRSGAFRLKTALRTALPIYRIACLVVGTFSFHSGFRTNSSQTRTGHPVLADKFLHRVQEFLRRRNASLLAVSFREAAALFDLPAVKLARGINVLPDSNDLRRSKRGFIVRMVPHCPDVAFIQPIGRNVVKNFVPSSDGQ